MRASAGGATGAASGAAGRRGPRPPARGGGFSLGTTAPSAGAGAPAAAAAQGLDALLALQGGEAVSAAAVAGPDAALVAQAALVLDGLGALQHALLLGRDGGGRGRLAALLAGLPEADAATDPALAETLAAVRLRAEIELARGIRDGPGALPR